MKISLSSSMSTRIDNARDAVNVHFANISAQSASIDAVHTRKREIAAQVKAGEPAPDAFSQEAELRDITVAELSDIVLAKPCPIAAADARELERQRSLLAVEAAKTPAEIDAALSALTSA
ncbi:hypothetical protein [Afipia felis]|uniref:Uncharacterized protein n=2 Tax=Afipia felis TaxID=1035 RepID=A0A380WAM2_AFIFE|nr:hypothetical protein [Afipia felis]EKS29267.1 hypothetical protein HMPREF9697_01795 [Afipia felis ATCC 53690]SUU77975.1 Uncharacterised protein [Afipia felis]SUU86040.1 Uncharacterised protein [Afipia felis]